MDEESRKTSIYFISHELGGSQNGIMGFSNLLVQNDGLTRAQKEYLSRVEAYSQTLSDTLINTAQECLQKYTASSRGKLIENSQIIMGGIEGLVQHSPVKKAIVELKELQEKEINYLNIINIGIEDTIYMHNQHFSPNCQRDEYHLDKDTKLYVRHRKNETTFSAGIELGQIHRAITKFDLFTKVTLPLIKNANDHAYNPKTDIYNRLNQSGFEKQIKIFSEFDPVDKELKVNVKDNGFGVSPEMVDKLFTKGASGRDNPEGHGLGLWLVKKFVEEDNGGIIGFDTELGKEQHSILQYHMIIKIQSEYS
jgi:signal transduction histidine kinase